MTATERATTWYLCRHRKSRRTRHEPVIAIAAAEI